MRKNKKNSKLSNEIIIILLMLILIMLIMAVATYDFVPSDIVIPETINYSADSKTVSVLQEIETETQIREDELSDSNGQTVTSGETFQITKQDLNMYSEKNMYNSGNEKPFEYNGDISPEVPTNVIDNTVTNTGIINSGGLK